jgi:hypothetical protein
MNYDLYERWRKVFQIWLFGCRMGQQKCWTIDETYRWLKSVGVPLDIPYEIFDRLVKEVRSVVPPQPQGDDEGD